MSYMPLGDYLAIPLEQAEWMTDAACKGQPVDKFYPRGGRGEGAIAICHGCPVLAECRQWALDRPYELGVWGGMTEADRHRWRSGASA